MTYFYCVQEGEEPRILIFAIDEECAKYEKRVIEEVANLKLDKESQLRTILDPNNSSLWSINANGCIKKFYCESARSPVKPRTD